MATATKPQTERLGHCTAITRRAGQFTCSCPTFVERPGRVDSFKVCARSGCGHTQNVHSLVEVSA